MAEVHGIYARIIAARARSQLAYRTSFVLDLFAQMMGQAIELLALLVVFTQVASLGGFSLDEALLMYGLASTAFGLANLLFGQVEMLPTYIRTGEFDVMLLRPLGALTQLLTADIALRRIGRAIVGFAVLGYALAHVAVAWTPLHLLVLLLAPLCGTAILGAIWVATNAVSFWFVDGGEFANAFTYGSNFSTSYPATVYGPWLRTVLCFAVPSAFVAYFPTLALLDRPDPLGLPDALRYCTPLVAAVTAAVAGLVWRAGVRRYQGTGS